MTKKLKEHTHTGSIDASGTAKGTENHYINTNVMSYEDDNGDKLKYIQQAHLDHHNKALGFNHFNPTQISVARNHHLKSNTMINEVKTARMKVGEKLNELGGMDQDGMTGAEGISALPPKVLRKNDQDGMTGGAEGVKGLPPKKVKGDYNLEEGPLKDKAKKAAAVGMTLANLGTLAHVGGNAAEGRGSPKDDILPALSTMSGPVGYGAMVANYTKKGYDKAREYFRDKKQMEERTNNSYPETTETGVVREEKKMGNPCWKGYKAYGMKKKNGKEVPNCVPVEETAAWQRSAGKDPEGGLNRKGIASYRREHPGSKLSMAVTTKPSKLDPDSKPAKRRKSFCARMGGMKGPMKDEKGRPTRKALSLRKWNCEENMHNKDWDQATGPIPEQYFHPKHKHTAHLSKEKAMKPDNIVDPGGVKGHVTPKMHTEETKMENQNLINEAIENIFEDNLHEMKENFMAALQEKAMEKLEERKKIIASEYFAQ